MKVLFKAFILAVFLFSAGFSQLNAQSNAERGTVVGAIVGAIVGHQSDEDLAGAAVGAVAGYMIGNEVDKRDGVRVVRGNQPVVVEQQPRRVIRRDPVYRPVSTPVYYPRVYRPPVYRRPSYGYGRSRVYRTGPVIIRVQIGVGGRYRR